MCGGKRGLHTLDVRVGGKGNIRWSVQGPKKKKGEIPGAGCWPGRVGGNAFGKTVKNEVACGAAPATILSDKAGRF